MAKRGRKTAKVTPKANDDKGYLESNKANATPYKVINGNKITMEGVKGRIYAIPIDGKGQAGKGKLLEVGESYEFDGATHVIEVPEVAMAQGGRQTSLTPDINPQYQGFGKPILDGIQAGGNWAANQIEENWQKNLQDFETVKGWFTGDPVTPIETAPPIPSMESISSSVAPNNEQWQQITPLLTAEQRATPPTPEMVTPPTQTAPTPQMLTQTSSVVESTLATPTTQPTEESNPVEATQRIQFDNPYGGVSIEGAAYSLGESFAYDGDKGGANTARGIGSGLKLLTGLGRNLLSGYGATKRNQYIQDETDQRRKNALKTTTSAQAGGNITGADLPVINDATGVDFNQMGADTLFAHTPIPQGGGSGTVDFGRYKDVGYFEEGEMQNGKRVIYNTDRNPMNYDDNRTNAITYLQGINDPESFIFKYREKQNARIAQPQVAIRKTGGEVTATDLLTGAYTTGNPNEVPNVEVEKGEYVLDHETGRTKEVIGKKHSQGGEKMRLEGKVLSDYNKIGGDLAKKYRDEYDIKVKAKDTPSTVMDKILKKTGYNSKVDDLKKAIELAEKTQEQAKGDENAATTGINMNFVSGKINELNAELEPLESLKSEIFERLFEDQQGGKSLSEIKEEESALTAATGKKVDPKYFDVLAQVESGNNPNAKASTSSASGLYQFTKGTWTDMVNQLGLDYTLEDRFDPVKSRTVVEEFTKQNEDYLTKSLGRIPTSSELYLAHFLGMGGAEKLIKAQERDPNLSVRDVVGADQIKANPNVFGKNGEKKVGDIYAWSNKKFNSVGDVIDASTNPYPDKPVTTGRPTPPNNYPEVDTTEKGDFDGDPNDKTFQRWFYNTYGGDNPTPPSVSTLDPNGLVMANPEITVNNPEIRLSENPDGGTPVEAVVDTGEQKGNSSQFLNLPDQTPLPPSSLKMTALREVSPREAEEKLISSEAQVAEINRQFMAAKDEINKLPDSQRRAALAQLNTTTQNQINQVMTQTNRANTQIAGQTEMFNVQTANAAENTNINLAKQHEAETLRAADMTEADRRAYFNRLQENQMGNYLMTQQMNLLNQTQPNFQYDGNGQVVQTGNHMNQEYMKEAMEWYGIVGSQEDEEDKKNSKKAKRGRKV